MFLKSKFLGVALATCVAVNTYANTCEQREKLGRASAELGFIIGMMNSDLFNGAFLLSLYSPYDKMRMNEQAFLKKAKERQKAAFAKKGLEWNETNIRNEERRVSQAYDEAVKDCEARQKKAVLD